MVLVEEARGGNSDNLDGDEKMNKEDNSSGYKQCFFTNEKSLDKKQRELEALIHSISLRREGRREAE